MPVHGAGRQGGAPEGMVSWPRESPEHENRTPRKGRMRSPEGVETPMSQGKEETLMVVVSTERA